ncbi:response regulator transcription factor, partial [Streptomyces atratus]|uniref:response regulator transcription factor n=1 Tax=Streptomyces atratus TaxID=1893 RepID=UPI003658D33D
MTNPIRLLLADDHPVVRAGLRAVLDSEPDFCVVAEAATAERAGGGGRPPPGSGTQTVKNTDSGAPRAPGPPPRRPTPHP